MKPMMRVTLQRGKQKKSFVIVAPPFPELGDTMTMPDKTDWAVIKIQATQGIEIKFPAIKAKQVFP